MSNGCKVLLVDWFNHSVSWWGGRQVLVVELVWRRSHLLGEVELLPDRRPLHEPGLATLPPGHACQPQLQRLRACTGVTRPLAHTILPCAGLTRKVMTVAQMMIQKVFHLMQFSGGGGAGKFFMVHIT